MSIDPHTAFHLANLFSALSDPTRLRIIDLLLDCELSVGEIAEKLHMTESAVSHQLRGLRLQRIVRARKQGRQVFYCLDDEHVAELYRRGLQHMEHE
ncbi:MAG: winged helix-turn-helix transcriptional regulator [Anaerolineales bacterium]|nr:winged helix-turn-helix transcriptional regulator [Anaerolineales bacterium]